MPDDEQQQNGEQSDEQPEGTPEEQQADEQQAPEEATPSEGGSPERGEGEGEPPEEALSEDAATEDDTPAEERGGDQPRAQQSAPARQEGGKKEDVVPGAELDPIAIEPERELDAEEKARREAEEEERLRRERELIGDVDEDATPVAAKPAKLEGDTSYAATGKRKSSVARVILRPGSGTIQVNKRTL
jgi:small subunit ribosomal protein S9